MSFKIIGCAFDVHNEIGFGFKEVIYQKALSLAFMEMGLSFKEQVYYDIKFKDKALARRIFDFVLDGKVVVEIKRNERFSKANIDQTLGYLRTSDLKLAILVNFGREGVVYRRLINFSNAERWSDGICWSFKFVIR